MKISFFSTLSLARFILASLVVLAGAPRALAQDVSYPPNSGFLNVKDAPYNAKGDGKADDWDAIQHAIYDARQMSGVYLPNGTYRVSKSLKWMSINRTTGKRSRMAHVWMHGQSRENTVIKLDDGAKGFNLADVSPFAEESSLSNAVLYTETEGNPPDAAIENYITNLTVDTGKNNPGAVGIAFLGNNTAAVRDVTIRSGDGTGRVGLQMTRIPGPCLIEDVSVDGFQYGVAGSGVAGLLNIVMDKITLTGQTKAAIINRSIILSINQLTSRNSVPALQNVLPLPPTVKADAEPPPPPRPLGLVQILNSQLMGGKGGSAIENNAFVFLRNVETQGYERALTERGKPVAGTVISEFATGETVSLFDSPKTSLDLPLAPAPPTFHTNDFSQWANVLNFAPPAPAPAPEKDKKPDAKDAKKDDKPALFPPPPNAPGPNGTDLTEAIQKAMNSGKPIVYFPKGNYTISDTITVPATVKTIVGMRSSLRLDDGPSDAFSKRNARAPMFRVVGDTTEPLTVEMVILSGSGGPFKRNGATGMEHVSRRPVVFRHGNFRGYQSKPGAGPLFVNDVVGSDWTVGPNQAAYFRQLNPEGSPFAQRVLNNGGRAAILGIKIEGENPVVRTINGGQTEVIGGFLRPSGGWPMGSPAYIVDNASFSASWGGMAHADSAAYLVLVRETRGDQTRDFRRDAAKAKDLMARGETQVSLFTAYPPTKPAVATNFAVPAELHEFVGEVPAPWEVVEINATAAPGTLYVVGPGLMIMGAGKEGKWPTMENFIGGQQDALTMAEAPLPGDGAVSAQLLEMTSRGTSTSDKVGLMMRQNEDPGSPMVFIGQHNLKKGSKTLTNLVVLAREKANAEAKVLAEVPLLPLTWMRLERRGASVQAQTSTDGQTWAKVGEAAPLAGAALAGFAAASESPLSTAVGQWNRVKLEGVPGAPPANSGVFKGGWNGGDIGTGLLLPNVIEQTANGFRLTGSGWFYRFDSRVWFPFVYQPVAGDQTLTAKVTWQDDPQPRASAALMMRDSLDLKVVNASILRTATGVTMGGRPNSWGGARPKSAPFDVPDPKTPVWLKLSRYGGAMVGFASLDGKKWQLIGLVNVGKLRDPLTAGMLATSHALEIQNTALFENVTLTPSGEMPDEVKNALEATKKSK